MGECAVNFFVLISVFVIAIWTVEAIKFITGWVAKRVWYELKQMFGKND